MRLTLGELIDRGAASLQTGPFGSHLHKSDYVSDGVPVVPTEAIGWRKLELSVMPRISEDTAARLVRHRVRAGDILFARRGIQATGLSAIAEPEHEGFICGTGALRLRLDASSGIDPTYLSFFLIMNETREWLRAHAVGAVMPNLNESVLRGVPLWIPPLADQLAIAEVLGTLDDKIEQNRRTSRALEGLARAVFKAWFVDFEPVAAKAAGATAFPGMPAKTFAALPNALWYSEAGAMPEGWQLSTLGTELSTYLGGTPSRTKPEYWTNGTIPWINSGEINKFPIIQPTALITSAAVASSSTKLIPARSTVIAITGATLGQVSIVGIATCTNQSVVSIAGSEELPSEFIYYWVKENIDRLLATSTGAAQQHVNKNNVNELPVLCPNRRAMEGYRAIVGPMFDSILHFCIESQKLASLRDYLLPRLLSGRVRVKDAQREVDHANA